MASWTARSVQLSERASWMVRSVQLARSASWMVRSVQLARSASWTVRSVWMIGPYSCFVVRDRLSEAWSKLSRRLIVWILFGVVTILDLGSPTSLFFWILFLFFQRGHFFGSFWCWFRRNRFWHQHYAIKKRGCCCRTVQHLSWIF